ncbi:MAG: hypothetical protein JRK53_02455 [Deltaproteobacteria bacterium]|nr:hypothetical protein [Deltaproteobacteria bacterium]MBW1819276.1 hypothetical protein [Deltaproteobacteria bacterium]
MKTTSLLMPLLAFVFLACGSCAQSPGYTPFTSKLYQELELDNANIQNIQVYYRAKKMEVAIPRTRDTRFHYETVTKEKSVSLDKKSVVDKKITRSWEDIILYNGTPGVILNSEKTRRKTHLLKVDFGDNIILDFENNRPDGIFYLITDRITLNDRVYVKIQNLFGYLVMSVEQKVREQTHGTIYEIRGKVIE